ncbi:alpha/beta hydrolase fold family protein [Mycobacterium ulcerans str. Harvey]|uniref:Alpha/beta hydrolase fold family protein n=1 Tax=Mycobacterium ulcerans str. Harvey TaxID=1299332 RepID=A0ABN0R039_MYCUL|nr:alpha/beta hydrolase fold family protein [Mycobacterium ulcerans str. Harvey]
MLVFYHGGGWALGDLDTHDAVCRLTCRDAGIHVLAIDYRLSPEHRAPAAIDDAFAAFEWAHAHAAELGALPGRVAVGGDSAGATWRPW